MLRIGPILLTILFSYSPSAFANDPLPPPNSVSWAHYEVPCKKFASEPELTVKAGGYGTLYFSSTDLAPCVKPSISPLSQGQELRNYFPSPGPAPLDEIDCPSELGCETELDHAVAPWIAIVDWYGWHGQSVETMVRHSTSPDVTTVLLRLKCVLQPCDGISDIDLLAILARLANAVDSGSIPAPHGINMSFGRLALEVNGGDPCQEESLGCQISQVLSHLIQPVPGLPPRTLVAAASGNHMTGLFPGSLDQVISVGSLDLTKFATDGTVQGSWETPEAPDLPDALMPGTALCLQMSTEGFPFEIPPPAGSSFATALYMGWIVDIFLRRRDEVLDHLLNRGGVWAPYRDCSSPSCPFLLKHDGLTFSSSTGNASDRIYEAFENNPADCGAASGITIQTHLITPQDNPLNQKSLVRMMAEEHRPAPESNSCVPCACCHDEPFAPSTRRVGKARAQKVSSATEIDILIDLHSPWKLSDGTKLLGLFLVTRSDLKQLDLSQPELQDFADGDVAYLRIEGEIAIDYDDQPSLVSLLLMDVPGLTVPQKVWNATQIIWRQ